MNRQWYGFAVAALLCLGAVQAQEMSERHIPVGAYPYLMDRQTTIGTLIAVDSDARTVTLQGDSGSHRYKVTDSTYIWLDRSQRGQTTADATLQDLSPGLKAEVRAAGPDQPDTAKWIKVQLAPAG